MKTYLKKLALTSSNTSRPMTKWYRQARLKAWFLLILMLVDILAPIQKAYALTSGPSQPEFQSFTPVGTTDMVNTFTGDFNYNIPLFELPGPNGGYPFNLAYNPSAGMDDESGPFGLGWNINPGAITRSMRGLPDDFDGDEVKTTTSIKDNVTAGLTAGFGMEIFGMEASSINPSIFWNSYKGAGYDIGLNLGAKTGYVDYGVGLSLNSQSGVSIQPSISFHNKLKDIDEVQTQGSFGLGLDFNSRAGLDALTLTVDKVKKNKIGCDGNNAVFENVRGKRGALSKPIGVGASYSFATPSFTPRIDLPWNGFNISVNLPIGVAFSGAYPKVKFGGNYVHQYLSHKGDVINNKAYGYLNLEHAAGTEMMMDFNRENDGAIGPAAPYLPLATGTADIYNVTSQGGGGAFRPYRSDVGAYHDADMHSATGGLGINGDFDATLINHLGVGVSGNLTYDESHEWNAGDFLDKRHFGVVDANQPKDFERVYFKSVGETTTEPINAIKNYIGGEAPMRLDFDNGQLKNEYLVEGQGVLTGGVRNREARKPRNTVLQQYKNAQLSNLGWGNIKFYDATRTSFITAPTSSLDRSAHKAHHIGAFMSLDPSGLRYMYALPVYNKEHTSYTFSVNPTHDYCAASSGEPIAMELDNFGIVYKQPFTDQYYRKESIPEYAHSHLLTSVLGADYIDVDNNGPSLSDKGYWVNFSYHNSSGAYEWRTPYWGAAYQKGYNAKKSDDKGNFTYGKKEIWDLARVETKTHVAIFYYSPRQDGHGANGEFNNTSTPPTSATRSNNLYKVDKIEIYARNVLESANPIPMKTIHFEYTYGLCPNVWNNYEQGANKGKLTLKKVYFTYEGNTKGRSTPYIFDYKETSSDHNPGYALGRYDRWGNYKSVAANNNCDFAEIPYVRQFEPGLSKEDFKAKMDVEASVWHLHKVTLPSGSAIEIEWEAKTYGHVQNKVATQMFPVAGSLNGTTPSEDLGSSTGASDNYVYFRLEEPIDIATYSTPGQQYEILEKYLDGLYEDDGKKQVYFRVKSRVVSNNYEYISGYSNVVKNNGLDDISLVPNTNGKWARIKVEDFANGPVHEHPFKEAAWQYLRTDLPELAYGVNDLDNLTANVSIIDNESPTIAHIKQVFSSLLSVVNDVAAMVVGYYTYCKSRDFGRYIDIDHSFVRLCSPDREKFGGGARVKQIKLTDSWKPSDWDNNGMPTEPNTYGQVYEYEGGVATYEPVFGSDETALRHPKKYTDKTSLWRTGNNLFMEYPLNESAYPAPSIGYSKVTVKSLATALDEKTGSDRLGLPEGIATTGKSVYEYYTAKDFPILTYETEVVKNYKHLMVMAPPFVNYSHKLLHGSYGVSTILNDMHGKPKIVASFGQDNKGNYPDEIAENAISWVKYNYKTKTVDYQGKDVLDLVSEVPCISNIKEHITDPYFGADKWRLKRETRTLGVDYEINNDTRVHSTLSTSLGVDFNMDLTAPVPFPIPVPTGYFNLGCAINLLRVATTNKIIRKTGIVESVEAYSNGAVVKTENLLYDALTGQVVLTRVNNSYSKVPGNAPYVYNYSTLAHQAYEGMGAAYKNIGLTFTAAWSGNKFTIPAGISDFLYPGDELLMTGGGNNFHVIYTHTVGNDAYAEVVGSVASNQNYEFMIIKSGRRNHLSASAGSVVALSDPTRNRSKTCRIEIPAITVANLNPNLNAVVTQPGVLTYQYIDSTGLNSAAQYYLIDSVLSASATTYAQYWLPSQQQPSIKPYTQGDKGIWRAEHTYSYVDDRNQTSPDPKLSVDGVMNQVSIFDYANPLFSRILGDGCNASRNNWIKVSTAISYSMENLLESMNALGIYSSSLYGYGGALMLAAAANARQKEIAYEGFEEYFDNQSFTDIPLEPNSNLTLNNGNSITNSTKFTTSFNILFGTRVNNFYAYALIEHPFDPSYFTLLNGFQTPINVTPYNASLNSNTFNNEERLIECKIEGASSMTYENKNYTLLLLRSSSPYYPDYFSGKLNIARERRNVGLLYGQPHLDNKYAHTGKRSLILRDKTAFNLGSLDFVPGKMYNLCFWVRAGEKGLPILDGTIKLMGTTIPVKTKPIEGWIRVDYQFIAPALSSLNQQNMVLEFDLSNLTRYQPEWYVDDIRVMPFDAAMSCSVYDPANYRLRATLDNNHYATFYQYDAEGNLTSVKRETEKGIVTVQYGQNNIKH